MSKIVIYINDDIKPCEDHCERECPLSYKAFDCDERKWNYYCNWKIWDKESSQLSCIVKKQCSENMDKVVSDL